MPRTPKVIEERGVRLVSLIKHEGWLEMKDELLRKEERMTKPLFAKLMRGEDVQQDVHFARGFIAALKWMAAVPEGAQAALERAVNETKE